jgi:hypothetical protein
VTTVQCAQCKAPYAVFGVEPPLEYVCGECTQASETPDPTQPCDFCGARVLGDGEVLGDGNLMCYRCMHPSARPPGYVLPPVQEDDLGGPPVLSALEERVAALEERLKGLERPDSVGCTDCNIVRALTGRGTARCRNCGPVGR